MSDQDLPSDQNPTPPASPSSPAERARALVRREPPRFRRLEVRRAEGLSPRLLRMTLTGDELDGFALTQPAASVRLLLPSSGTTDLVMPTWRGNEFLLPDGRRPVLRTLTPRNHDAPAGELDVDIVLHGGGAAEAWALAARPGDPVAISGPGRGYDLDPEAPALLLAGDETALPAIAQLLEHVPPGLPVQVHVEVARPEGRLAGLVPERQPGSGAGGAGAAEVAGSLGRALRAMTGLGRRRGSDPEAEVRAAATGTRVPGDGGAEGDGAGLDVTVTWYDLAEGARPGDALVAAVKAVDLVPGERVWAAGEAAAVQQIRKHLFDQRGLPRAHAHVRGYWKHGRAGDGEG
jgi:NADPH-dependent ferric siderophore reductase